MHSFWAPSSRKFRPLPAGSVLGRFLVLLMVWQSAAPICHVHIGPGTRDCVLSATERIALAIHRRAHHGESSDTQPEDDDWHFHFGQPSEVVPACEVQRLGLLSHITDRQFLWAQCSGRTMTSLAFVHTPAAAIRFLPSGFLAEFGVGLAFPLRLCVARC
jgi:hypothetical protein